MFAAQRDQALGRKAFQQPADNFADAAQFIGQLLVGHVERGLVAGQQQLGQSLVERLSGNVELSKARSEAVTAFLTAQGVPAALITPVGLGEAHPLASNTTAPGRAKNQRVEIDIVEAPA